MRTHGFGVPDMVTDTVALKDGKTITREDRPLTRAMRGEHTDNEEFSYLLPDGRQRYLLSSARPILGDNGGIIGAVQISLDISDRKKVEQQRDLLTGELNHRVEEQSRDGAGIGQSDPAQLQGFVDCFGRAECAIVCVGSSARSPDEKILDGGCDSGGAGNHSARRGANKPHS